MSKQFGVAVVTLAFLAGTARVGAAQGMSMPTQSASPSVTNQNSNQELLKQLAELRAQLARLQKLVEQQNPTAMTPPARVGGPPQGGMMGMDKSEMTGMSGGGMAAGAIMKMDKGEMGMPPPEMKMEMGGMGAPATGSGNTPAPNPPAMAMPQPAPGTSVTALPGVPGASHLYHVGSTGFFLDQAQLKLSTEQQTKLNQIKERAVLARATADRKIEQAEQELWALTGAGQPDAAKIQPKLQEIEQLRTAQRLAFITAVGEATSVLTPEQRDLVVGIKK